jgi:hypothetical protein
MMEPTKGMNEEDEWALEMCNVEEAFLSGELLKKMQLETQMELIILGFISKEEAEQYLIKLMSTILYGCCTNLS